MMVSEPAVLLFNGFGVAIVWGGRRRRFRTD